MRKNQELDLGVQFGILNSRLNFSVDWFNRKSYDLIGNIDTLSPSAPPAPPQEPSDADRPTTDEAPAQETQS